MNVHKGVVQKGTMRGRTLGYPTINIPLEGVGVRGVYAARVLLGGEAPYFAAAFADDVRGILEAHILDFSGDLYGKPLTIELHAKLRETASYASGAELKAAIAGDIAKAREYFRK